MVGRVVGGHVPEIHSIPWQIGIMGKDKSPVVPFHGITLPYSYFEEIWIFVPIQQEAKYDKEKLSAELKSLLYSFIITVPNKPS